MCSTNSSETLNEKFYSFIKLARSRENAMTPTLSISLIFTIGITFQIVGIVLGYSYLYIITYVPFIFMLLVVMIYGLPYPFEIEQGLNYFSLFDIENEGREAKGNFLLCSLVPAPFFISSIIYINQKDPYLMIILQMLGIIFIILSILIYLTIFHLKLPESDDDEN
jgi:hypothetical protein